MDAIDFSQPDSYRIKANNRPNVPVTLVNSQCFTTNLISFNEMITRNYTDIDSFVVLACVEGSAVVDDGFTSEILKTGEVILIPAVLKNLVINPGHESKILEVYIL